MKEIWKDIPGYEGFYKASNKGRIKSFIEWNGSRNRILRPATKKDGHLHVCLYKHKKGKIYLVHQLVMLTFVGERPQGTECLHIDGNHKNNQLSNLRYGTHKENMRDCSKHGKFPDRRGTKNVRAKLLPAQVVSIRKLYNRNAVLPNKEKLSQLQIADIFGVSEYAIWAVVNRKTWNHLP